MCPGTTGLRLKTEKNDPDVLSIILPSFMRLVEQKGHAFSLPMSFDWVTEEHEDGAVEEAILESIVGSRGVGVQMDRRRSIEGERKNLCLRNDFERLG